jgi:hypothetical protein
MGACWSILIIPASAPDHQHQLQDQQGERKKKSSNLAATDANGSSNRQHRHEQDHASLPNVTTSETTADVAVTAASFQEQK